MRVLLECALAQGLLAASVAHHLQIAKDSSIRAVLDGFAHQK
jgi:hypothetical protein